MFGRLRRYGIRKQLKDTPPMNTGSGGSRGTNAGTTGIVPIKKSFLLEILFYSSMHCLVNFNFKHKKVEHKKMLGREMMSDKGGFFFF